MLTLSAGHDGSRLQQGSGWLGSRFAMIHIGRSPLSTKEAPKRSFAENVCCGDEEKWQTARRIASKRKLAA